MRRLATAILLLIFICPAQSQTGNNWYFGERAGITFNTNPPTALLDGQLHTQEGCAAMSDGLGNLLFYTDGITVWNRNHLPMPNGTGLMGHPSSTHSALIVPQPGSPRRYFIFTSGANNEGSGGSDGSNGYRYSIVDMNMDGGLGNVDTKNTLIYSPNTEKLAATVHADGVTVWIITKEKDNDLFRTYHLTCQGLSGPQISSTATLTSTYTGYRYGCMKVSPDGTMIANARNTEGKIDLFQFDKATGLVSNRLLIPVDPGSSSGFSYGVEFSPDSKKLYAQLGGRISQFDVSVYNQAQIEASRYIVVPSGIILTALQLGPDGKIYVNSHMNDLGVINSPNSASALCDYQAQAISLQGRHGRLGLPTFLNTLITPPYDIDFTSSLQPGCAVVDFAATTTLPPPLVWEWDFGDGSTALGQNVTHTFPPSPNEFNVTVSVSNPSTCGSIYRTKRINLGRTIPATDFDAPTSCGSMTVNFHDRTTIAAPATIIGYQWDFGDGNTSTQTSPTHTYTAWGDYTVRLTTLSDDQCGSSYTKTATISVRPAPVADFTAPDTCAASAVLFASQSTISHGAITSWQWDFGDGNTSAQFSPAHNYAAAGTYTVRLIVNSDRNCGAAITKTVKAIARPLPAFDLPSICVVDATAAFTNHSTISDGSPLTYNWHFGDPNANAGNPDHSTLLNPSHSYAAAGIYPVKLIASTTGCRDSLTQQFTVNGAQPRAKFKLQNRLPACNGDEIIIKDSSYVDFGSITRITIEWGDGNTITDNAPGQLPNTHTYNHRYAPVSGPATQTFIITIRAYSGTLCVHEYQQPVDILASPQLEFNAVASLCHNATPVLLNAAREISGLGGNSAYSGQGIINANGLFDPSSVSPGDYNVTYTYTSDDGCIASASRVVAVKPMPVITASAAYTPPGVRGQQVQLQAGGADSYIWSPATGMDNPAVANPLLQLSVSQLYQVEGTKDGCTGIATIEMKVLEKEGIYVPSAFTPNGDGLNDFLRPVFAGLQMKYFRVYDRWGNMVFESRRLQDQWDGRVNGRLITTTTFVWVAEAILPGGDVLVRKGTVTLIR